MLFILVQKPQSAESSTQDGQFRVIDLTVNLTENQVAYERSRYKWAVQGGIFNITYNRK